MNFTRRFSQLAVALLAAVCVAGPAHAVDWTATTDGDWFDAGNWFATPPNATDAAADFVADITTDLTVNLDAPATVGSVLFADPDGSNSYSITGPNNADHGRQRRQRGGQC